uniref:Citrate transporter-like domain-containing protein n=1 Tax=Capitella teleta TaxID=283909 RepID=X1YUW4_CAPTE
MSPCPFASFIHRFASREERYSSMGAIFEVFCVFWRTFVTVLTPIIFLPMIIVYQSPTVQCGYVILIMAVFWITECVPMGLTAFLPIIIFPTMGLMSVGEVRYDYLQNTHLMIFGSVMIAIAVERSGLHKRAALRTMMLMGASPRRLLFGVMFSTWFLSMWLNNIGTTAMIIPVVDSIIKELRLISNCKRKRHLSRISMMSQMSGLPCEDSDSKQRRRRHISKLSHLSESIVMNPAEKDEFMEAISKMLMVSICYAGNIGGTSSVIGTTPNILAHDIWQDKYQEHGLESPVTFVTWMPMAIPGATIMLFLTWLWLQIYFLRRKCSMTMSKEDTVATRRILQQQYDEMGPMKYSEKSCLTFFIVLFFLWFFRKPGFMPGYASLFPNHLSSRYITDSVPSILISFLLFVFPSEKPKLFCFKKEGEKTESVPGLLEWKHTMQKLPWTAFFMIGGAFAMAEASEKSGLSNWVGVQLEVLESLPSTAITLIVCVIVSIITQIAFNLATISLVFPILISLSEKIGEHPLRFTIPATMVCSSAFMLPASTAPNAMVYEASTLRVIDMIGCGFVVNILFVLVTWMGTETWIGALFQFSVLPWLPPNSTVAATIAPLLSNVTMAT